MARRKSSQDVTKLPKWAQRRITMLEESLASANREARAATTPGVSNTMLHEYAEMKLYGLPPFGRIRFGNDDEWIEAFVKQGESKDGSLVVELYSGTGNLIVRPCVANVIYVKQEQR